MPRGPNNFGAYDTRSKVLLGYSSKKHEHNGIV